MSELFIDDEWAAGTGPAFASRNPGTGATIWVQQPFGDEPERLPGANSRTIGYWSDGNQKRIFVIRGQELIALDASNGRPIANWATGGRTDGVSQREHTKRSDPQDPADDHQQRICDRFEQSDDRAASFRRYLREREREQHREDD